MFLLRTKIVNFMVNMYIHRYNIYRHRINRIYVLYILSIVYTYVYCCFSVTQLCPTLCYPMDYRIPGFPVLHHLHLLKLMSVMPSNHLILCHPLLLLPSVFSSFRVFSNESALLMS